MTTIEGSGGDRVGLGITFVLLSVTAMAFADAVIKLVSADMSLWQVFVIRSAVAAVFIACIMHFAKSATSFQSPVWVLIRSLSLVLTWLLYYASLPVLDLAVAAVAVYTNPIFTTILASFVVGGRILRRQWLGVLIGFAGVVAILGPGIEHFSYWIVLPLIASLCYSVSVVITNVKCAKEDPVLMTMALQAVFVATGLAGILIVSLAGFDSETAAAAPFLLVGWPETGWFEWGVVAFLGFLSALYFLGVVRAYQIAPPQIIATFDYGYLVSAAFWGFVLFSESPDGTTWIGMILISAAGYLVVSRK